MFYLTFANKSENVEAVPHSAISAGFFFSACNV